MSEGSHLELQMKLRQMGYSERAINEILKWYKNSDLQADGCDGRDLRFSDIGQQKHKH